MLKLGKLPPRKDHRTLQLGAYLNRRALPDIPSMWDWGLAVEAKAQWGMMLNNKLGICAIAAPGHTHMAWTANALGQNNIQIPSDDDLLKAYMAVGGYVPGRPDTDQGCIMLDVMNYWRQKGIAGHKIEAFVSIDSHDPVELSAGGFLFGGVQLGLALPKALEGYFEQKKPWVAPLDPKNARGVWAPGSWGGHAVPLLAKNKLPECITWAARQGMSEQFIRVYSDEAYVGIDREAWFNAQAMAPNAISWDDLWTDLASVTDGKVPIPPKPPGPTPVPGPTPTPRPKYFRVTIDVNSDTGEPTIVKE